jgi:hypothetical protein
MSSLREPRFELRRRADLRDELIARAKAWLPDWRPRDTSSDFAGALLEIAARLESEVAQRLDKMPEKMFRDFLAWLGVRGQAAEAARLPLVFHLTPNSERVLAEAPVRVQASPPPSSSGGAAEPITFETEKDLMIVPGTLAALVAVDPSEDAFYRAAASILSLDPPKPGPQSWTVKALAKANSTQIQLDPALGLDALPTLLDDTNHLLYRVTAAQGGLVTVEPRVGVADAVFNGTANAPQDLPANTVLKLAATFDPFGAAKRNRQEHAVYIGSESLLNLPTAATIQIRGITGSDITWFYWGKTETDSSLDWRYLKPDQTAKELTLQKSPGSVEILKIGEKSSRWLKGTVAPKTPPTGEVSHIALVVNPEGCAGDAKCPADKKSPVVVEGIANTTPLVFDTGFYPLGREPRLFDAFYLGCPEAFSKPNASVQICLEAQNGTAKSLMATQATSTNATIMLFGVGTDGFLHRMQLTGVTQNPVDRSLTAVQPPINTKGKPAVNTAPAPLISTQGRLNTCTRTKDALVAVVAASGIWIWAEDPADPTGNWYFLGNPSGGLITPAMSASVLLMTDGPDLHLVAAINGALSEIHLTPGWESAGPVVWPPFQTQSKWTAIAPIFDQASPFKGAPFANGWIGVTDTGQPWLFKKNGNHSQKDTKAFAPVDPAVSPLAVATGAPATSFLFVDKTAANRLDAWQVFYDTTATKPLANVDAGLVGKSFDWTDAGANGITVVFANQVAPGSPNLAAWFPQDKGTADHFATYLSPPAAGLAGSPAVAGNYLVAPGTDAAIIATKFTLPGLAEIAIPDTNLATALVVQNAPDYPKQDDIVVAKPHNGRRRATRLATGAKSDGSGGFWIEVPGSEKSRVIDEATVYREESVIPFHGKVDNATSNIITAAAAPVDPHTHQKKDPLAVTYNGRLSFHTIQDIQTVGTDTLITITPKIRGVTAAMPDVDYNYLKKVDLGSPALLPLIDDTLTDPQINQLIGTGAYFRGAKPAPNPVLFKAPGAGPKFPVVLQNRWKTVPAAVASNFALIVSTIFEPLVILTTNKATNPSLSWEYFDGQSWRTISSLNDTTSSLRSTGIVRFCVPADLKETDVAGRKSFWIRARLVGGDYGQEKITVHIVPDTSGGGSTQTVDRSLSDVSPPVLGSVNVSYSLCVATDPDYIITSDGGETRDQTAANTADAAKVELFTPLADFIQQASSSATPDPGNKDRAIYLGFDGEISGTPINVLFLAKDQDFGDDAFPSRVDVLRETGFEHLVPQDGTRGLGETGIVSFDLVSSPPPTSLFGAGQPLRWVRLRPSARFTDPKRPWKPQICAAYVNGVFARASETQDLERLGSSDGSPGQKVALARPPVLKQTLELRVCEPLGEEDVAALRAADPANALDKLPSGQPGPWIRWTEIPILEEAQKDERRYALNSDNGEITFGDGIHGRIPPIGTDSIVAIRYKRGGGVAANDIAAWSELNLISPVQGIDRVAAPDNAAGGSDPQTADEVVRYAPANQFMRDRALTLRDFETLAIESSRDIVQARALESGAGIRLVAVVRGQNPKPTQAQARALQSYLADRSSPSMAAPNAIAIVQPRLVKTRIDLTLTVRSIEFSGAVDLEATQHIVALLDPATGGLDGHGWPLGLQPAEADIAAALTGIPNLEAIESIKITPAYNGVAVQRTRPEDLPDVSAEDIVIKFTLADVEVEA